MAKDSALEMRLDDLSDAEIERIEAMVFCLGGPPCSLSASLMSRACQRRSSPAAEPALAVAAS